MTRSTETSGFASLTRSQGRRGCADHHLPHGRCGDLGTERAEDDRRLLQHRAYAQAGSRAAEQCRSAVRHVHGRTRSCRQRAGRGERRGTMDELAQATITAEKVLVLSPAMSGRPSTGTLTTAPVSARSPIPGVGWHVRSPPLNRAMRRIGKSASFAFLEDFRFLPGGRI
jgi:hypothetical protein